MIQSIDELTLLNFEEAASGQQTKSFTKSLYLPLGG